MIDSFIMVWVMEIAWDEPLFDVMDDCGLQWIQVLFFILVQPLSYKSSFIEINQRIICGPWTYSA
jgi:hypothetical protein